jgi:hypothetical protein
MEVAAPMPARDERDFLVIYEEETDDGLPGDDHLILDIEAPKNPARGELDVQQRLDLSLTNSVSRTGSIGFVLSCVGALSGAALLVFFMASYPSQWYNEAGYLNPAGPFKATIAAGTASIGLLIAGTMMTHYGRRIQARGNLSQVRIVEKAAHSKTSMR